MTRRKFSSKFKTKVVLEALKERMSMSELARKFELQPQQIVQWKKEFLNSAENVFEKDSKDSRSDSEKEKDRLLKAIGELKVENDFLKNALR
jgi:transposase